MSVNLRITDEQRASSRKCHLIFLAHLALCGPLLAIWMLDPHQRTGISERSYQNIYSYILLGLLYLVVRAILAFRDPRWLRWEIVFPPIDVIIVSLLMWAGDGNPLGHTSLLYLFPLTEAATTLSVSWSMAVAFMVAVSAGIASKGFHSVDAFATTFRYIFFFVVASMGAFLAKANAATREQLGVAQDRQRIALEMHDGVQAHLVTISAQLELAGKLLERDPAKVGVIARESRESARLAADELRYLVQRLRSPALEEGFLNALKQFAHNVATRSGLAFEFLCEGEPVGLPPEVENALFRIAQEAMTNTIRHAQASLLKVCVAFRSGEVELSVCDDGRGLGSGDEAGNGLESMEARAMALKGSFQASTNKGTTILVRIPVPKQVGRPI